MKHVVIRRCLRVLGGILPISLLVACGDLPGLTSQISLYEPEPSWQFQADTPSVDWQLLVEEPNAPGTINTGRIALKRPDGEFDYFASRQWSDPAPVFTQSLLIEAFEKSGKIVSVGRDSIGLRSDYLLKADLRELQAEYRGDPNSTAPTVRVQINTKLVRMPRREIIAGETFDVAVVANSPRFEDVVRAFDRALGSVLSRIVDWTLVQGAADASRQKAERPRRQSLAIAPDRRGHAVREEIQ